MVVNGSFCENCGARLEGSAFCTSCGTPVQTPPTPPVLPPCGHCGTAVEPGTVFCTGCGANVAPGPVAATVAPAPVPGQGGGGDSGRSLRLVLMAIGVAGVLAVAWLAAGRTSGDADRDRDDRAQQLDDERDDRDDDETDGDADGSRGDESTTTTSTTTTPTTTTTSTTTTTTIDSVFTGRDVVLGRYVAVLWSEFTSTSSPGGLVTLERELADFQRRFGSNVIAIDSNQFRSLRDGTVAVVFDGGFASAREAKRWCRNSGFPGTQDCFGVVLSDDFSSDQRGEFIRVYDL